MQISGSCDKNDVIMMSLPETMKKCGHPRNQSNIYHSKGLYQIYSKMSVISNLSDFVKSYRHLSKFLSFLPQALSKYG